MNQIKKIKTLLLSVSLLTTTLQNNGNLKNTMKEEIKIYDGNLKTIDTITNEKELSIFIEKKEDLSWLKAYPDLESLKIYNSGKDTDISFLNALPNLKKFTLYERKSGSKTNLEYLKELENLEYLEINSPITFDLNIIKDMEKLNTLWIMNGHYENLEQLKNAQNIKELRINVNENTPKNLLESLTHLKKIKLYIDTTESLNYQKFTFLEELSFGNSKPYSIAVNFNTEDYDTLTNNKVKVTSDKEGVIEKVIEINTKLDEIITTLNINDNKEEEKFSKTLSYILETLTYDHVVASYEKKGIDIRAYAYNFYKEGLLYGALEMNSAICGSYASFLKALLSREKIECLYLQNEFHAWNLVKINNVYYYTDPTLLDTQKSDKWYLINPNEVYDKNHISNNLEMDKRIKKK